jgi:hypothetical protein
MKHRLKYLTFALVVFTLLGIGIAAPAHAGAADLTPGGSCQLTPIGCKDPITNKPVEITKACPSSMRGFPTTRDPNLINLPMPDNNFVQCEINWAKANGAYVPGMPENGGGSAGVADYCHRNFTSTYLTRCNNGYADGAGAECGKDDVCKVGAYARIQLDKQGQNNSTLNPATNAAQEYCDGKTGKAHKACIAGYQGQVNGKDKDEACKNLDGDLLATCQSAWTKAKSDADGGGDDAQIGCEANVNPLSWVVCPVISMMSAAIGATDNLISQQMVLPADDIFCLNSSGNKDTCDAYYSAWASFRNIALGLIVIATLIVVIAQAVGMDILDAYTIRKMLPRILVAAIAITLSWPLMNFAVTLSNNLGFAVRDLITAPFRELNNTVSFSGDWEAVFAGGGAALIGVVAGVAALGILLSYVATAGLAVLIAILVLVVRQIVIIAFVIISPIAIIAYVLPNTERIFRMWWESFSKALLMFPLIIAFIATGRVFSAVALSNSQSLLTQITALVAYFGPYFAIPLTFRMSGSIMGGVGNAINQRGQPAFARLSQYRKDKGAAKLKNARAGQLFNEDFGRFKYRGRETGIAKMANKLAVNVTDQDELLPYRLGKEREFKRGPLKGKRFKGVWGARGYSADLQDQLDNRAMDESSKLTQEIASKGGMHYEGWRGVAGDISSYKGSITRQRQDGSTYSVPVSQALTDAGFSAATPPSDINDFRRMGHILKQSDSDKERQGGNDILEHAGTLASAKRHPDMEYADTQVAGLLAMASAGRIEHEPGAAIANSIKKRVNPGVAQRALKSAQSAASRTERPDMRDGHAFILNANGEWESVFSEANHRSQTAYGNVKSIKGQAWSGAKAEAVTAAAPTIVAMAKGQAADGEDSIDPLDIEAVHEMIEQGIRNPYNDAGQRAEWRKIKEQANITSEDGPVYTADEARRLGLEQPPTPEPAPEPQQQHE